MQTDPKFMAAVVKRFGEMHVDLAASLENAQASVYVTKEQDSLTTPWASNWPHLRLWLNPEFSDIGKWAARCANQYQCMWSVGRIFLLTPASIGANWFAEHVAPHARVIALNGRLTFVGHKKPYVKDCILSVYGLDPGFEVWNWRK